ncbi:hypothetical protein [Microbulbifer sp. 2205BS26-8]|uniref:hypothetical protein n=1 Tax=Microbulbifer sp. 2205BS26-8 TaxID=3064386 RepID=UPI00273F0903|nr:hypothetical protein [Microbulbifer sp. 2205BS26-8]MDP5210464.1 hypothetical protein [Microbulbifer sp. 2205BS26-8]
MKKNIYGFAIIIIFFMGTFASLATESSYIKNSYNKPQEIYSNRKASEIELINREAEKLYAAELKPIISDLAKANLGASSLEYLFQATKVLIFYNPQIKYVEDMQKILNYLDLKKIIKKPHYVELQEAYIATRQFDKASSMVEKQKLDYLQEIPKITTEVGLLDDQPTILVPENSHLIHRAFNIPKKGPYILVISNPLCGFSARAAEYISKDKRLREVFSNYSLWLSPPSGDLQLESYQNWKKSYPKLAVGLMHNTPPWPKLDTSQTPVFYFFLDGNLYQSLIGWPRDGAHIKALNGALVDIGLLKN